MNFNICIKDTLSTQLDQLAQQRGKKRNTVIHEALENWVKKHNHTTWPGIVMNYKGEPDAIAFESYRDELILPVEIKL